MSDEDLEDDFESEVDQELEAFSTAAGEHISLCEAKTCYEKFGELRERALREGRAFYYIHGTFFSDDAVG